MDKLEECFRLQEAFMRRLVEHQADFPKSWPLDLKEKANQLECKHLVGDIIIELAELVKELKNAKKHRKTSAGEIDREKIAEEAVDAFKFFLELLIFVGLTPDEFFEAYKKKDAIIHQRLDSGV